jgi:hypothetical protein
MGFLPPALASNAFSRDIPPLVTYGENTLRIVVMILPFLMPLEVATAGQRRGLLLACAYLSGDAHGRSSGASTPSDNRHACSARLRASSVLCVT